MANYFQATMALLALAPWAAQVQIGFIQMLLHCPRNQGRYSLCCLKINTLPLKMLLLNGKVYSSNKGYTCLASSTAQVPMGLIPL
jgi:hypothetical protein